MPDLETKQYEDIVALHDALNDLLPFFIYQNGRDYNVVDKALQALARHPELPTTVGLIQSTDRQMES
jgi:hypothetical protein